MERLTKCRDDLTERRSSIRVEEEQIERDGWAADVGGRVGRIEVCLRRVILFCILFVQVF